MSAAWGRSPEEDETRTIELLGVAEPVRLIPRCIPCAQCGDYTDAGESLCPACIRHARMEES